jgi:hypothetical protein
MQYIGLAFDMSEPLLVQLTREVVALAQTAGYTPRVDWLEMTGDGLVAFVQRRGITRVVFLNAPSRPSLKVSSDGITQDVFDSALEERPSRFEQFLAGVSALCADKPYYVVMGEEWYVYQYVRYHEGPLAKLATLLRLNRSWRTQLYNFETESTSSDGETPLIFHVIPGPENTPWW